jgi:uncharacterized protein YciI
MSDRKQFILVYRPPRSTFLEDQTEEESAIIRAHFNYLQQLHREGVLLMAGRCEDATFGIAIIEAASESEAQQIMAKDPAIKGRVFSGELRAFRIALGDIPTR